MRNPFPVALLALALAVSGARAMEVQQPAGVWLTPEVLSLGGCSGTTIFNGNTFRLASVDLTYGRLRFGTSLLDGGYSSWSEVAVLPVRVGITLWQQPRRYVGKVYGMTPAVSLQANTAPWLPWAGGQSYNRFVGQTAAQFNMNIYGMAFEVGAGVEVLNQPDYLIHLAHDEYSTGPFRWSVGPLLEMRVGFGVASIRL